MKDSNRNALKLLWMGIKAYWRKDYEAAYDYTVQAREMSERNLKKYG